MLILTCRALEGSLRAQGEYEVEIQRTKIQERPRIRVKMGAQRSDAHSRPRKASTGQAPDASPSFLLSVMSLFSPLASGPPCAGRAIALYSRGGAGVEGPISGLRKGQGPGLAAAVTS